MTTLRDLRLAACTCSLWMEPQAIREARRDRYMLGYGTRLSGRRVVRPTPMTMFDPMDTEHEWDGKVLPRHFWVHDPTWLRVEDFFMSDREPRPPQCHHYCEVEVGQVCCRCGEKVRPKPSGIGCPCGHTWFCA